MVESMTTKFLELDITEGNNIQPLKECEASSSNVVPLLVKHDDIVSKPVAEAGQQVSKTISINETMPNDIFF